ncbi:MAG: HAD-IA family hydrolase [Chthoniobacterales bacterium]
MNAAPFPEVVFFDAVGTLIHLPKSVGHHYALVGSRAGLNLDTATLDHAFARTWREMPTRPATGEPREDDDKGWWRTLVQRVLGEVAPTLGAVDRETFFELAYDHFAGAGVWELYPEAIEVLESLRARTSLAIISNFDGRLRVILERLGISKYFSHVILSSEVGADKPDPLIFQRALELAKVSAPEALHVGDDPVRDWQGAEAAGLAIFKLERPRNSLREVLAACVPS